MADGPIKRNDTGRSFIDLFGERVRDQPSHVAIRSLADDWSGEACATYAQLDRHARLAAAHLIRFCVEGDRVVILLQSGIDYVASLLGCFYAGLVAVPAFPADSDLSGHAFRYEGGHPFRFQAGQCSDLMSATSAMLTQV